MPFSGVGISFLLRDHLDIWYDSCDPNVRAAEDSTCEAEGKDGTFFTKRYVIFLSVVHFAMKLVHFQSGVTCSL
jgi:hypothetical protein